MQLVTTKKNCRGTDSIFAKNLNYFSHFFQGELAIHSLPELRRQVLQTACMKKEDVQAISTLIWTPMGEAFFMCSSSEIQRISVAAARHLEAKGIVILAPNARPEIKEVKKVVSEKSADGKGLSAAGDSDSVVARQNQLNEKELAQGNKAFKSKSGRPLNHLKIEIQGKKMYYTLNIRLARLGKRYRCKWKINFTSLFGHY